MIELPSRDVFAGHMGEAFSLSSDAAGTLQAVLESVSELRSTDVQEQFSLTFTVETQENLEQSMYIVANDVLGDTEIFMVPVGRNEKGLQMQAVFNKLLI